MPVVFMGLMTMVAAQLFDLSTFLAMLRRVGPTAESNPFVVEAMMNHGLPILVIAKLVTVGFVAALHRRARANATTQPRPGRSAGGGDLDRCRPDRRWIERAGASDPLGPG